MGMPMGMPMSYGMPMGMPMGKGQMPQPMQGQGRPPMNLAPGARPGMGMPQGMNIMGGKPVPLRNPDEPLTASHLAASPPGMQKQMLGEKLFPRISRYQPELAGKIHGHDAGNGQLGIADLIGLGRASQVKG